jgi:hypothetical protein
VSAAHAGAAVPADGVDLVDEDDRRGIGLGLLEQVAHPAGADADEHLDEVRSGDREERDAGLPGDRPCEQGLAGSGRPEEQHTLGDLGAHGLELDRVLQEVLDLLELLDRLVRAGDVGERGLRHVLRDGLGLGLAELHDAAAAALHGVEQPEQKEEQDQERQEADQDADQDAVLRDVRVEVGAAAALLAQEVDDLGLDGDRVGRADLFTAVDGAVQVQFERLLLGVQRRRPDVAVLDLGERRGGRHVAVARPTTEQRREGQGHQDDDDDPEPHGAEDLLAFHTPMPGGRACRPARRPS